MEKIIEVIKDLWELPRGINVERPAELISTNLKFFGLQVYFTRRSLKHLIEKGKIGIELVILMPHILEYPDEIRRGRKENRYIISKSFDPFHTEKFHALCLEKVSENMLLITAFPSNIDYLKNYDLLWRTADL